MKITKRRILIMGGIFSISGLGLMFASADKDLSMDLNNAIQHIEKVKIISTGNDEATMTQENQLVQIETDTFILSRTGDSKNILQQGSKRSTILGGFKNKINGTRNVILGGSGNEIMGTYNTILGGEGNKIVLPGGSKGSYSTILGGKGNTIISGSNSVIAGSDNTIYGSYSVVAGKDSHVTGENSAALGSNSNVKANNSFLWTDGQHGTESLNADNVFAVVADSGMVINSATGHRFAKLTIGGPMVLVENSGANIACGGGQGGGILKAVSNKSNPNQICLCSCDGTKRNSMFDRGKCRSTCDEEIKPECGTEVVKSCENQQFFYSGSCASGGKIVEGTGAYFLDKNGKLHWSCQSDDGSVIACSGSISSVNTGSCGQARRHLCTGLITGAAWINSGWTQTYNWNIRSWEPTTQPQPTYTGNSDKPCSYQCKQNYTWNPTSETCEANTQTGQCTGLPENAEWVNGGTFIQTWNGSEWTPASKTATFTGDSSTECLAKCSGNYTWNGTSCEAPLYQCTGSVPSNAILVTGSDSNLTEDTPNTLYPSRTEAGNNKCAYVCKVAEKFVYDPDYGKCTKINTFCSETTPYKCEYSATVTNTGGNDNEYTWDCEVEGEKVESCSLPKTSVCNLSNKSNLRSNQERCTVGELDGTPEYKLNPVGDPYREYKCKLGSDIVDCSKGTNVVHFYGPEWRGRILKDNIDFTAYFPNYLYGIKYKWNSCGRLGGVEKRMGMDINGGNNNGGGQPTESQFPGPLQFNGWLPSRHSSGQPIFEYESGSKIYSITGAYSEKGNYLVVPYSGANISTKDIAIVTINNCPGNEDNVCNYVNGDCKSGRRFRTGSTEENGKTWVCEKNGMIHNCSLKWECKGTCKNNNENCVGMYTSSPRDNKYNCEAAGVYRLKPYGGSTIFVRPCRYSPTGNLGSEYYNILGCNSIDTYDSDCRNRQNSERCEYAQCFKWNPEGRVCNVGHGYSGNITEITQHTGNEAYMWCSNGAIPTPPLGRCEYTCRGAVPYGAVPAKAGNTGDLIEDTEIKLYASKSAAGNKKCAYVCNAANKFVYDPDYGKCIKINSFCSETPNECLYGATSDGHNVSGTGLHTWNCRVDGQFVERCTKNSIEPGSCTGCPSGIVGNGGTCISYNTSSSCDKWDGCAAAKITSNCNNGEWDNAPGRFSTCGEYTGNEKVCVGSRTQYHVTWQDWNQSWVGCEHFHPNTSEFQFVGLDCSELCELNNNGDCAPKNLVGNNYVSCCNCQNVGICELDIPGCATYNNTLSPRCGNREYRKAQHLEYPGYPS